MANTGLYERSLGESRQIKKSLFSGTKDPVREVSP
jgi:hypothetical protein